MGQRGSRLKKSSAGRKLIRGNTELHRAAKDGHEDEATNILKSDPGLVYETNDDGDTALHIASRSGHHNLVEYFLQEAAKQPEVEARLEDGTSHKGNLLKMQNLEGNTPLHEAVRNGYKEIVESMIKADSSLASVKNNAGDSPLFLAVDGNFFKVAIYILEHVSECSYEGRKRMNVLHVAAIRIQDSKS